jgi:Predicted O-methyltransferase
MDRVNDEKVDIYLRKHLNPYEGIFNTLEAYAEEHAIPIVQPEVARLLCLLAKTNHTKRILEVGCAIGYSTLLLSQACPDAEIVTIERDENMIKKAQENIKLAGRADKIQILQGDACEIIPQINMQNKETQKFDFIFLDAAKSRYNDFLPHCIRLLLPGGLLVCDNVLFRGMVARDYDEVPHAIRTIYYRLNEFHDALQVNSDLESSVIPMGDGVSVSIRK